MEMKEDNEAFRDMKRRKIDDKEEKVEIDENVVFEENKVPENLAFHLTTLENAPDSHNLYAKSINDLLCGNYTQCLLANYMIDIPWLFGICPRLKSVPVILVHGERNPATIKAECQAYTNVKLISPPLPIAFGTHHTKMMVIIYESKVRVVICTANFIPRDWTKKTQGIWFQDFELKRHEEKQVSSPEPKLDFEADLIDYLSSLGSVVKAFCQNEISRFDFSNANVALIPSVPGVHKGSTMEKYGHLRLRKLLKMFNAPKSNHPLICQFSSMGSLDEKWLFREFSQSLAPDNVQRWAGKDPPPSDFHIIWPSVTDVRNSLEGWNGGRSIPCTLKNMKPFLHKYLRKWTPPPILHRQNAMPHIKTYSRIDLAQGNSDTAIRMDWAVLTSSNLSKAAWGAFQKNNMQFMIRSYELGVLFVPKLHESSTEFTLHLVGDSPLSASSDDIHMKNIPLPLTLPITTYDPKSDEPWVWDIAREDPDIFGSCYIV